MANFVSVSGSFERKAKRLLKKYPSFAESLELLENQLIQNPTLGTSLGNNTFKLRFLDKSKGGGKSGGFRAITYLVYQTEDTIEIILLTLYDKSEQDTIGKAEIKSIISEVLKERKDTVIKKK